MIVRPMYFLRLSVLQEHIDQCSCLAKCEFCKESLPAEKMVVSMFPFWQKCISVIGCVTIVLHCSNFSCV